MVTGPEQARHAPETIVIRPGLRDPIIYGLTVMLAILVFGFGVGAIIAAIDGGGAEQVLLVATFSAFVILLTFRSLAIRPYVKIGPEQVSVGLLKKKPRKTVVRTEIAGVHWPRGKNPNGQLLNARGGVIALIPYFIERKKVAQVAKVLGVPFSAK